MIDKPLDQITRDDIDALITDSVMEGRTRDYKETLPEGGDDARREFYADVSSMANTLGGDLIYGLRERRDASGKPTGEPEEACGLASANIGNEILGLENGIRSGIAPRIIGIRSHVVPDFPKGPVLILRVPHSLNAPHMVTYKSPSRFYARTSAGKQPLDVHEIRAAFLASEALPERIRNFRADRLARIVGDDTPVSLRPGARIVLHLVPLSALSGPSGSFDLQTLPIQEAQPIYGGLYSHRFNFDGRVAYSIHGQGEGIGYVQIFRNGIIEAVDAHFLNFLERDGVRYFPSGGYEPKIVTALGAYLQFIAQQIGAKPPIILMVSLLGVRGFAMWVNAIDYQIENAAVDRDNLVLPELFLEDVTQDPETILKPLFEAIWQAAGYAQNLNYDKNGRRRR